MDFSILVETFEKMEKTTSRLMLTDFLVDLFKKTPENIVQQMVYLIQGKLGPDFIGLELGIADKMVIKAIANSSGLKLSDINKIFSKTGDLGKTSEIALENKTQTTLISEDVSVERVYDIFNKISRSSGKGSQMTKIRLISSLLNDSLPNEGKYIVKFLIGNLRLGIADYSLMDALAIAFTDNKSNRAVIEKAYNQISDLGEVANKLYKNGIKSLNTIRIEPLKPVRPMLAERVLNPREALERGNNRVALEYKLDGERAQIHKKKDQVNLYSRSLENITSYYPELKKEFANKIKNNSIILEGEIVPIGAENNQIKPFQELMHRKRKHDIEKNLEKYPVSLFLFDVLYIDGDDVTDQSYLKRRKILENNLSNIETRKIRLIPNKIVSQEREITDYLDTALKIGAEGLMVKQTESVYRAGAREYAWMKLKKEYDADLVDTLDLVIIGALFGKGRRTGKYGALLLAIYDSDTDSFPSVCKVGTGFTDEVLETIYNELKKHILSHKHPRVSATPNMDVWFEPKIVLEIIGSEITLSPLHRAGLNSIKEGYGLAIRFPKFTGKIRSDKLPEQCTTTRELVEMYHEQIKKREIS
ncbi:MAG: ATP-dependent DNA ligase [Nitrososphaeraceae archaeon]|nr:ATP-dependent DNA ligase [Nitrososphaeraceae archaeon]